MKGQPTEIWKIFNMGDTTLEIPVYQRNYDWGTAQCARLFDDLESLALADKSVKPKHFFGAVVGKTEGSWKWVVIDGQQRLTTVSLLMLAITRALEEDEIVAGEDSDLGPKLLKNYLLNDSDPRKPKFKLKPVKNDAAAYRALFGPEEDFVDSSNVTANYRYFRERLRKTNLDASRLWDAIRRLEVMHLDLEEHDDPQSIFESLNSTGLNLSESDKIRNLVLMNQNLAEQERLYEDRWNPIEENVDYRTDWFIRWYLTAKTSKTPRENDVFEAFKRYVQRSSDSVSEILDDMFEYSKNSRAITHASTGFPKVDRRLRRANLILSDVVYPFLMPVIADAKSGRITENDLDDVVRIIESYIFRRSICQVPANSMNKTFATAYNDIRKLRTDGQSYASLLTWILRRRDGGSGRFPNDVDFRESFATRDMYHLRPSQRQYLFDVLENGDSNDNRDIAAKIETGDLTIEHIMPQTLTKAWEDELGPNAHEIHDAWENRIGNLTVTGYNSTYSNSSFSKKQEMEGGFSTSPYRLNIDVKSAQRWDEAAMSDRSHRLSIQAIGYWKFIETDFKPPEVVRPTEPMGTDTSFRSKVITAYEFGDISETVESWTEAVPKIVSALLDEHRSAILAAAKDEPRLTTNVAEADKPKSGYTVVDPGLAVQVNTDTNQKIGLLRRLFERLGLDPEDLIFTLRPTSSDQTGDDSGEGDDASYRGKYAALTKFSDAVAEAAALQLAPEDTAQLREEFKNEFEALKRENALDDLQGRSVAEFTSQVSISEMTPEQVLAVITLLFATESMVGQGVVHNAIVSGEMSQYLDRLTQSGK
ncbi:DUF262 domain-containing protein [Corynebacterium sp. S7]